MSWQIEGFIWLEWVVEKITQKHGVSQEEVEEVFRNPPYKVHGSCKVPDLCVGATRGSPHTH